MVPTRSFREDMQNSKAIHLSIGDRTTSSFRENVKNSKALHLLAGLIDWTLQLATHTLLSTDVHIRTDHVRYTLRYLHCFSVVSCPHPSDSALNGILTVFDCNFRLSHCRTRIPYLKLIHVIFAIIPESLQHHLGNTLYTKIRVQTICTVTIATVTSTTVVRRVFVIIGCVRQHSTIQIKCSLSMLTVEVDVNKYCTNILLLSVEFPQNIIPKLITEWKNAKYIVFKGASPERLDLHESLSYQSIVLWSEQGSEFSYKSRMNDVIDNPADCEVRSVIRFLNARHLKPAEIYRQLKEVYGDTVMNERNVRKWCEMFNNGRTNVHDELLDQFGWEIFDHPPYSPDLAPSDFHLFTKLKDFLGGTRFGSDEELKTVNTWLNELAAEEYNTGILKLVNRHDKCLNVGGDYVEK
ncbi:hypothetical protein ANN_26513 [Periplaneta americana]|uniref:Mos1 transposase HTH domain-containing protein n=1 Tax=Periplaneta americana TaxID=6978 RepID=A0ABQ8RYF8_PERAM|nr:hypothetical protein ANN_26513 [Periplaneta americana]